MNRLNRPHPALLAAGLLCSSLLASPGVLPLSNSAEQATTDASGFLRNAVAVKQIPAARSAADFSALDLSHVLISTEGANRYVLTLSRQCPELRWAKHVGVTASGNSIWAGFDALTADGHTCQITEIHRLTDAQPQPL